MRGGAVWGMMKSNVLLKNGVVCELLAADRARRDSASARGAAGRRRRLGTVDAHVGLEVALGGEGAPAEPAAVRPEPGVRAVVHQQRAAAAEHAQTHRALVRVQVT